MFAYSILYAASITIITFTISYPATILLVRNFKFFINDNDYSDVDNCLLKTYAFIGLFSWSSRDLINFSSFL